MSRLDDILVQPLTSRDLPNVRDLHSKVLPVSYPPSFFLQLLVIPTRTCLIAYKRGHPKQPLGFISAAIQKPSVLKCLISGSSEDPPLVSSVPRDSDLSKPCLEILTLGVLPSYQQRGLARLLVQRMVDNLGGLCAMNSLVDGVLIYANVSTSNTQALTFYKRMGMVISSEVIKNLYRTLSYGSKDAYLVIGIL
ncbi:hypothetical protein GALMADRAFT_249366 [Galerina marginata CBS 339.88]|uniref:N-alpha-acetyltransferase 60 n=1 Tax=Galerina marginata (strain CBS 339.88) TaxID=685588 RepID=A0A067SZ22_GALM3|nr:hypothetical protein GALMADRAFT_249366 [Galerina marginata CBS 339.88]